MSIVEFLASRNGRITRGAVGLILIGVGGVLGGGWRAVGVIGIVPLAAAVFDFCLFGPLIGRPLSGRRLRVSLSQR